MQKLIKYTELSKIYGKSELICEKLDVSHSAIQDYELPTFIQTKYFDLSHTQIKKYRVTWKAIEANLSNSSVNKIENGAKFKNLDLSNCPLKALPDQMIVTNTLNLSNTKIIYINNNTVKNVHIGMIKLAHGQCIFINKKLFNDFRENTNFNYSAVRAIQNGILDVIEIYKTCTNEQTKECCIEYFRQFRNGENADALYKLSVEESDLRLKYELQSISGVY